MAISAKKGKTRIAIEVCGVAREILSLDARGEDVAIYMKTSSAMAVHSGGEHAPVKEQRFSVHVSPKSAGHTIKQTLRRDNGVVTTSALVYPRPASSLASGLVLPRSTEFRWPIFATRPPTLASDRYILQAKPHDQVVSLGSFDPNLVSLVYMVVATSKNVPTIQMTRGRTRLKTVEFKNFHIHVVYGFSMVPALPVGDFLTFATAAQRTENKPLYRSGNPQMSLTNIAVEGRFFQAFGELRDRYAERFTELPVEDGTPKELPALLFGYGAACCVADPPIDAGGRKAAIEALADEARLNRARRGDLGRESAYLPSWLKRPRPAL